MSALDADATAQSTASEWVYLSDVDEPEVFETHSSPSTQIPASQPLDSLFASTAPVEEVPAQTISVPPEVEFIGDDIVDDRIPPEQAFCTFLNKNFPVQQQHDFSGSLYNPVSSSSTPVPVAKPRGAKIPGAESRSQRLERLCSEVEALASEVGHTDDNPADATFSRLTDLRKQLRAIEHHSQASSLSIPSWSALSSVDTSSDGPDTPDGTDKKSSNVEEKPVSVQVVSPAVSVIADLERRISVLETAVAAPHLEATFDGTTIADVLEDVRTRLAIVSDPTLPARLKEDAGHIAQLLRKDLSTTAGKQALRVATLLDKFQTWQPTLDALPLIVDRLAAVRRLHTEAAAFTSSLASLAAQLDRLESRHDANTTLVETVRNSLKVNMDTVKENLEILKQRIDTAAPSS